MGRAILMTKKEAYVTYNTNKLVKHANFQPQSLRKETKQEESLQQKRAQPFLALPFSFKLLL
jgi:hypothetical protein